MYFEAESVVAESWKLRTGAGMTESAASSPVPELEQSDDRALVEAVLGGRREAFDVIVRRHERQVYRLCYRFVGNHEDAADLAQDVFVRAFRGLRTFKGDSALTTWLYRIGVNVCLNRVTSRRPALEGLDGIQPVDERAETPFDSVSRAERAAALRRAIRQLPPKQRAAVVLRVYQDLPHEQIARILGSSVG
ncbi:MAG TPA: RNA polymerase sigma factor, partial [Vicinamibacterales bacterium]|nr:RNA polymerase sigma factor [Vicinamibacterales bacterium]